MSRGVVELRTWGGEGPEEKRVCLVGCGGERA